MAKLDTVNIIEYFDNSIQALHAFTNNDDGWAEAENLFEKLALEQGFDKDDILTTIHVTGYIQQKDYSIYLFHSKVK